MVTHRLARIGVAMAATLGLMGATPPEPERAKPTPKAAPPVIPAKQEAPPPARDRIPHQGKREMQRRAKRMKKP